MGLIVRIEHRLDTPSQPFTTVPQLPPEPRTNISNRFLYNPVAALHLIEACGIISQTAIWQGRKGL